MNHEMHGDMSELDDALMSKMRKRKKMKKHMGGGQEKMEMTMHEFKEGTLHSGSKSGPVVTNRKQAIAIGMHKAGLSRRK